MLNKLYHYISNKRKDLNNRRCMAELKKGPAKFTTLDFRNMGGKW